MYDSYNIIGSTYYTAFAEQYGQRVTEFSDKFTRGLYRYVYIYILQVLWRPSSDESSDIAANRCSTARNRYLFSHRKS